MFNVSQIQYAPEMANVFKILLTGILAFLLAFAITPLWTHVLYRYKLGIRIKKTGVQGDGLTVVSRLHAAKAG
nr:hypothetical protein [Candidatus Moranbacteria bacterium]